MDADSRLTPPAAIRAFLVRLRSSELVRDIGETFGVRAFLLGAGLINTILIARALGPDGRGLYAVAIAVGAIGYQVANLGLHSASTFFVARDRSLLPSLVSNAIAIAAMATVLAALAFAGFAFYPELAPVPIDLMAIGLAIVPALVLAGLLKHLLIGIHRVRAYNAVELVSHLGAIAVLLVLLLADVATPLTVAAATLLTAVLTAAFVLERLSGVVRALPRPSIELMRRCVTYGFRIFLATVLGYLVLRLDLLVVQYLDGAPASGQYSIATSLADVLLLLPAVVGLILFPRLATIEDDHERWALTRRTITGLAAVFAPLLILSALLAGPAIDLVFGQDFSEAASPFRILCAGMLFLGTASVLTHYLAASGLPWFVPASWAGGFVLNLALDLALIPSMGIDGAAVASTVSFAFVATMLAAYSSLSAPNTPRRSLP